MAKKPQTFDDYFAALSKEQRAALEKLRSAIRTCAPDAEEGISYGLAAFRCQGKPLVALGATANHCAFYLMSGSMVAEYEEELRKYDTSKGTIRFSANTPLPASLVKKLVKARLAENARLQQPAQASTKRARQRKHASDMLDVEEVLSSLRKHATKKTLAGMAKYAIPSGNALGVAMKDIQALAKQLGKNHAFAQALWESGWYEARLLAAYVDDPTLVNAAQMDRWCRDFDNWAICDTVCFALFDRTSHAWSKVPQWASKRDQFVKRGAFALLWGLTVHDKDSDSEPFLQGLRLIERAANDERHYVKKAVNMALRASGKRNRELHTAACSVAERLASSSLPSAIWIGKDALRDLRSAAVLKRVAKK